MPNRIIMRLLQISVIIAFVMVWHLAVARNDRTLIPSPASCLAALSEMVRDGVLMNACGASLQRVLVGFALAVIGGVGVGLAIGLVPALRRSLVPFFELIRPIPPIAWIPIAVSLLGIGDPSAYLVIFIGAFFPILTNTVLGVTLVERAYLDVGRVFGASQWRAFVHVILPSSLPSIFAGLRVGLGFAWMCVVAAEMFAARSGLGYEIQLSRQIFRLDRVVASMAVIGAIGFGMSRLMTYFEWLALPWRREQLIKEGIAGGSDVASRRVRTVAAENGVTPGLPSDPGKYPHLPKAESASVEINSVSFTYPTGPTVLRDVSLQIKPGEVCCILGKSGCGKSTLLRLLAGLETRFEGAIRIDGEMPGTERSDVAMAFQHASLFPWKTAAGNVRFALRSRGVASTEADRVCREVLALVGLDHKAARYPHQLSGGQQQRVAMARAIACHPRLLLLDEPLSALDNYTRETLQGEISALLHRSGITTVLVTHDISEAIFMSDRIALMSPDGSGIISVFEVPEPRPRPVGFRAEDAFSRLHTRIWGEMRTSSVSPVQCS